VSAKAESEALSGSEGQLEIMGLEVMAEGVRAGTHLEGCREGIADCRNCNAKTTGTKQSADIWDGEQISI